MLANSAQQVHPSWKRRTAASDTYEKIAAECGLLPLTAKLLVNRGVTESQQVRTFLNPQLSTLIHPGEMHALDQATDRILTAINSGETIMIHGDYDADGVTSTALLYRFFRQLGVQPEVYIPNRLEENHGISARAIEMANRHGVRLVITCDCGISSAAEIAQLKQLGIDTVVTDHHLVPDAGPPPDAIVVNPTQQACDFGDENMSGVGMSFYLAIALRRGLRKRGFFKGSTVEPNLRSYLDLVALGTIADVAPLLGQNRIFVRLGLEQLERTDKLGLRVLLNLCLPADRRLTAEDIAFYIAPKLNAAGRLGRAKDAFALLVEQDPIQAAVLARKLINDNQERKKIEERVLAEAMAQAERLRREGQLDALVLYEPHWHLGVLGIVANRLVERYQLPAILLARQGDRLRGSGRSLAGIDLVSLLKRCQQHLVAFGGHRLAAGVTLLEEKLDAFRKDFVAALQEVELKLEPAVYIDDVAELGAMTPRLVDELEQFKPFGEGNPEPLFACCGLKAKNVRTMGEKRNHVRMVLQDEQGATVTAVGFRLARHIKQFNQPFSALLTPEYNIWRGRKTLQARIHAIHPTA